ncbi:hypothetical protein ACFL7M_01355 [Thermodesulfobacteriota bacterium]
MGSSPNQLIDDQDFPVKCDGICDPHTVAGSSTRIPGFSNSLRVTIILTCNPRGGSLSGTSRV